MEKLKGRHCLKATGAGGG